MSVSPRQLLSIDAATVLVVEMLRRKLKGDLFRTVVQFFSRSNWVPSIGRCDDGRRGVEQDTRLLTDLNHVQTTALETLGVPSTRVPRKLAVPVEFLRIRIHKMQTCL